MHATRARNTVLIAAKILMAVHALQPRIPLGPRDFDATPRLSGAGTDTQVKIMYNYT